VIRKLAATAPQQATATASRQHDVMLIQQAVVVWEQAMVMWNKLEIAE